MQKVFLDEGFQRYQTLSELCHLEGAFDVKSPDVSLYSCDRLPVSDMSSQAKAPAIHPSRVAIDDCTRYTYAEVLPDDKRYTATAFWLTAVRVRRRQGIHVQRVLTDNGGAYRS